MTAEVKRDRYGRYLIIRDGGPAKPYTRATTIASTLSDSYGLTKWKMRTLASGLALRDDIYARVAATDPNDRASLDRLCDDALEAGRSSAGANYGTALHEAVARVNRGEDVTMPAPWDADLAAYRNTLAATHVTVDPRNVEQVCVLDDLKVAGTFDAAVTLPDGTHAIADLKTGQQLDYAWHEIAIQLALYARADAIYDPATAFRRDMPPVRQDLGLVIHLPAGQNICSLHTIDLAAGWEAAQLALNVRAWRNRRGIANPYRHDGPAIATNGARDALKARIEQLRDLGHLEVLAQRWPAGVPGFKSEHAHTVDELAAIAAIVSDIEQQHAVPF